MKRYPANNVVFRHSDAGLRAAGRDLKEYRVPDVYRQAYNANHAIPVTNAVDLKVVDPAYFPEEDKAYTDGLLTALRCGEGYSMSERICPFCHNKLYAGAGSMPMQQMAIIGGSNSGKTTFEAAMIYQLTNSGIGCINNTLNDKGGIDASVENNINILLRGSQQRLEKLQQGGVPEWSATENYLRAFNEMYNAGTLDPNFYLTTDDAMEKGKFVSGECGTYSFYMSNGTDVFTSLLANDPDAEVAILNSTPSIVAEGYTPYYYEYPSYGMIMGINSQSTDEERAAVYMFLEWLSQPENLTYMQYGVEGETYTVGEDGINTLVADYTGEAALSQNQNKDYWCLVVESITYGDEEMDLTANKSLLAPAGYEDLIQQSYDMCKANEDAGLISPIFTSVVESSADYTADLKALWQEAYVACITAAPEDFDATYEEYCQEYLDAGYQDILDEKQELIDAGSVIYAE